MERNVPLTCPNPARAQALLGDLFGGSVVKSYRLTRERQDGMALAHGRTQRTDLKDCQRRFRG
jgi:hypothetical protein